MQVVPSPSCMIVQIHIPCKILSKTCSSVGTRLFKHLKTRIHLCIFPLEDSFNQLSTRKVSFEVFLRNIIRAARFFRRCNSLQHPSEISPHATSAESNNGCKSKVYTCLEASSVRHDRIRDKGPSLLLTLLLTYCRDLSKKGSHLIQHLNLLRYSFESLSVYMTVYQNLVIWQDFASFQRAFI